MARMVAGVLVAASLLVGGVAMSAEVRWAEDDAIFCIVRGDGRKVLAPLWSLTRDEGDRRCSEVGR